ncbi:MBL fold metallo-hydrolase [bacterium]|nr:MBL fold metallo-hydrolase [bacterium]
MILILVASLVFSVPEDPAQLEMRFLGNEAFEITDGTTTILSDFPYESGAFGYMTYDPKLLNARKNAYCLITHQHQDHFDASLHSRIGCKVLGPPDVMQQVAKQSRVNWEKHLARVDDVNIRAIPSTHGKVDHYSYRVEWKNKSFYFVGDTDDPATLLSQPKLDVLFITPWLLEKIPEEKLKTLANTVVIYHHAAKEEINCSNCILPKQGQTIRF